MSIRPMDMQIIIPNATEVGKSQHHTDQQNVLQQQNLAGQWSQIAADRQHQVQSVPKNEHGKVHREKSSQEQHKENGENAREQQEDNKEAADKKAKDPVRGVHVDIKT